MPVFVDQVPRDHHLFAEMKDNSAPVRPGSNQGTSGCLNIGLVNNMPDSALISTERQLFELLKGAAGGIPIRLRLFTLPTIPRGEWGRQYMSRHYSDVDELWVSSLDGLIVTGTEPRAPHLTEEPYWDAFAQVIDWAKENTVSAILSCLAVHGAVLHLDGIDRQQLAAKCIGVFDQEKNMEHPLLRGAPSRLKIPHSRWNEVREETLVSNGYSVLTKSSNAGVDTFVKQQRNSLFVYFQGHPEYEAQSLLGEYRRDIGRYLRGEVEAYPTMPKGYFDHRSEGMLIAFQTRALSDRRNELLASFPVDAVAMNLKSTWRAAATCIYRNWLLYMSARSGRRLTRRSEVIHSEHF
jgi:homoserine O-succinyltransferase/O-acetyltransferase